MAFKGNRLHSRSFHSLRRGSGIEKPVAGKKPKTAGQNTFPFGVLEAFVVIQFLSTGLLFIPGMQNLRFYVRALPYLASMGLLVYYNFYLKSSSFKPDKSSNNDNSDQAKKWLHGAFLWLIASQLLHPFSHYPAGLAQCLFQICIAAPCFWAANAMKPDFDLTSFIRLILYCNFASAGVGALQVYYPEQFIPPEFSRLGLEMNEQLVNSLTYQGAEGQEIVRPPGLTDMPGGASGAAMNCGFMGIILACVGQISRRQRAFCLFAACTGMFVLYLTQVRSLFLVMLTAICIAGLILWRSTQQKSAVWLISTSVSLVIASFLWAVSIGGESVSNRFLGIAEEGVVKSYQTHRGGFLRYTLNELVFEYPFGAGVGRWGMMRVYFPGDPQISKPSIHAEIQMTGWLLDGGVLMWLLYGGAIFHALRLNYRICVTGSDNSLIVGAVLIFCLNLALVAQSFAGPTFNTQAGIQFWLLYGCLHEAYRRQSAQNEQR